MKDEKYRLEHAISNESDFELFQYLLEDEEIETLDARSIPRREERGRAPLSFAQQRLWFLEQMEPGRPTYNVSGALRLEGTLDAGQLARSLDEIVSRHEALRTTITTEGTSPVQVIHPRLSLALPFHDLSG